MADYHHLHAVATRDKLRVPAEPRLKVVWDFPEEYTNDEMGHFIAMALAENSSSWLLFNLAATYWRIQGDGNNTMECLRRAGCNTHEM